METDKKPERKGRIAILLSVGIAVFAVLFTIFRDMGVLDTWRLSKTRDRLMEENAGMRDEIERLRAEVDKLRTNSAYIEEIARKDLGLIKDKENVIVLDNSAAPAGGEQKRRP
jgi:cell division protein FtsB